MNYDQPGQQQTSGDKQRVDPAANGGRPNNSQGDKHTGPSHDAKCEPDIALGGEQLRET